MPSSPTPARLLLRPTVSLGVRVLESMSGQAIGSARSSGAVRHARRATPASLLATPRLQQITTSLHQYRLRIALATSLAATWIHLMNQSPLLCTGTSSPLLQSDGKRADLVGGTLLHAQTRKSSAPSARRSGTRGHSTSTQTSSRARSYAEGNTEDTKRGQGQGSSSGDGNTTSTLSTETKKINDVSDIGELMRHPDLMKDIKKPRNPIVLCHGLYGFDVRGPFWGLEIHYWASILDILRKKVGAEVIVRGVPSTGAIADRAEELHKFPCTPTLCRRIQHQLGQPKGMPDGQAPLARRNAKVGHIRRIGYRRIKDLRHVPGRQHCVRWLIQHAEHVRRKGPANGRERLVEGAEVEQR